MALFAACLLQDWEEIIMHECENGYQVRMHVRRNVEGAFRYLLANPQVHKPQHCLNHALGGGSAVP